MAKRKYTANSTPREEILHYLLEQLAHKAMFSRKPDGDYYYSGVREIRSDEHTVFCTFDNPKVGDLVIGGTRGEVGILKAIEEEDHGPNYIIQPVGLETLVRWTNENLYVIRGVPEEKLYVGKKRQFLKLLDRVKFWHRNKHYSHIIYRVELTDEQATLHVRERFGGTRGSVDYTLTVDQWQKHKTVKGLAHVLLDQGWGTRKFEREPCNKPEVKGPEGQA